MSNHLLIISFFLNFFSFSQNLVPNPSFELINNQPCFYIVDNTELTGIVQNWTMPTAGSPDIYSNLNSTNCYLNCFSQNIGNVFGYQTPRTGNYMAGLVTYGPACNPLTNNYREYLQVKLTSPLVQGDTYYVEFYVSLAENMQFASDGIGVYFSNLPYFDPNQCENLVFTPQIVENNIITNTTSWTQISGQFVAQSNAEYLTIGNFYDHNQTSFQLVNINNYNENAYYFIDDVTVKNMCLNNSSDTTLCSGDSITLTAYSNNFLGWAEASNPNSIITTDTFLTVSPLTSTNYLVLGTCDTNDIWVNVTSQQTLNIGNDTTLCPNATLTISSNINADNYLWSNNSNNQSININSEGTYWLEITQSACSYSDTIQIDYFDENLINLGNDTTICPNDSIILSSNLQNTMLSWSNGSNADSIIITNPDTIWIDAIYQGCSYSDTIVFSLTPPPYSNLVSDTVICENELLTLTLDDSSATYLWPDGSSSNSFTVNQSGTYWVEIQKCFSIYDTITVNYENCDCNLYIPNTFTPDADNINDQLVIRSSCPIDEFHFVVYNRWGKVVFETYSIQDFWDGTIKKELTNTGCFSYSLNYSFSDDAFVHRKYGQINLLY